VYGEREWRKFRRGRRRGAINRIIAQVVCHHLSQMQMMTYYFANNEILV
jgi:hypothetical protein